MLHDVNSVVLKVVIESALAHTVVLVGAFNDSLLEEAGEVQDLNRY